MNYEESQYTRPKINSEVTKNKYLYIKSVGFLFISDIFYICGPK